MAEVIRVVDEPPPSYAAPVTRPGRWHLRHRWAVVRVDGQSTYVGCASCGRLRTPTLFEPPVP